MGRPVEFYGVLWVILTQVSSQSTKTIVFLSGLNMFSLASE